MADGDDSNTKGNSGERVVALRLELPNTPLRIATFGEKWPVVDTLVEFERNEKVFYFFAQVKSTATGLNGEEEDGYKSIQVDLRKEKHELLGNHIGPTYLIGVDISGGSMSADEKVAKAYICTVRTKIEHGIYTIPVSERHELNKANVEKLYNEVVAFWENTPNKKHEYESSFDRK